MQLAYIRLVEQARIYYRQETFASINQAEKLLIQHQPAAYMHVQSIS